MVGIPTPVATLMVASRWRARGRGALWNSPLRNVVVQLRQVPTRLL